MFEGKAVANAAVTFSPMPKDEKDREPGRSGTGFTDAEGYYVISTHKPYDGALVGQHRVRVALDDANPARCKRNTYVVLEVKADGNELNIELEK